MLSTQDTLDHDMLPNN